MKNKIVLSITLISFIIYLSITTLEFFPEMDLKYSVIFTQIKILNFMVTFAIIMFVVFSYSILSYLFGYVAFYSLISLLYRIISLDFYHLKDTTLRIIMHLLAINLTILTFYILKRYRVNLRNAKN